MRIKYENTYTHFGVTFSTNKPKNISLASFIKRDYKLRSYDFFASLLRDDLYKVFDTKEMLEYFYAVKKENNEAIKLKKRRKTRPVDFWCNKAIQYLEYVDDKTTQKRRRIFYKQLKSNKKVSFEEFQTRLPSYYQYLRSFYVFDDSLYYLPYSDAFFDKEEPKLVENYNLNMDFFNKLDSNDFNDKIKQFCNKYKGAIEITDLNDERASYSGYYVLILDEYKQVYIGASSNIKERILQHWKREKQYDRRIFVSTKESKISIDSFGPFDTTRIIIVPAYFFKDGGYPEEDKMIRLFTNKYVSNRIDGNLLGGSEVLNNYKTR